MSWNTADPSILLFSGQYHWVSEFAPVGVQKVLSYVVGWFCVLGWQAGIAGQSFSVGT